MTGNPRSGKAVFLLAVFVLLLISCSSEIDDVERADKWEKAFLLVENMKSLPHTFEILEQDGERHLLFREDNFIAGSVTSKIWAIKEGKPMLVLETPNACFMDHSGLAIVKTFLSNSAGGRIWQRYYLYWDKEKQCYQEYAARKITEEEFLSLKNAKETKTQVEAAIREEIEGSGGEDIVDEIQTEDYIKRDNGIININYKILCGEQIFYRYAILTEQDGEICSDILPVNSDRLYEWGYIFESGEFDFLL